MERRKDGEDLFMCYRCDLLDLETLGYHILVRYHNLVKSVMYVQKMAKVSSTSGLEVIINLLL